MSFLVREVNSTKYDDQRRCCLLPCLYYTWAISRALSERLELRNANALKASGMSSVLQLTGIANLFGEKAHMSHCAIGTGTHALPNAAQDKHLKTSEKEIQANPCVFQFESFKTEPLIG